MTRYEMEKEINRKCGEYDDNCDGCPLIDKRYDCYGSRVTDKEVEENYKLMFEGENNMKLKDLIKRIGNRSTKIELRMDDTILCTCSVQSPVLDVYGEREVERFAISQVGHNTLIIITEGGEDK